MKLFQGKSVKYYGFLSCFALILWSYSLTICSTTEEICDNAMDDNGNGLIDLNDPECDCEIIEPISLIPNPSFEDMNCCPNDRSQLDCAEVWIQASEPTTDYIHTCDYMGWDDFPPPVPFPDGEGIMGFRDGRVRQNNNPERNWKEYAGACLISPLIADTTYRFEFHVGFVNSIKSPPINISFFGTRDCDNLPFGVGNQAFGCPTNGPDWVRLGSTWVSGDPGNRWVKASIDVVPEEDIRAIAIGPDCPHVSSEVSIYYFFDNLLLADFRSFELQIKEVSHPCQNDFSLKLPETSGLSYQWYKDGIALIGETSNQLSQMYGEGDYQIRVDDGESCRVSIPYIHNIPIITAPVNKIICKDEVFQFGDQLLSESGNYVDTFKSVNNCDSIVYLNLKVLGVLADTVQAKIFEGETYEIGSRRFKQEGDHLISLVSSQGCDSLVLLQLEYFNIFIPNAFSPNGDGINDYFTVLGEAELIENIDLSIFDRWGNQLYTGPRWDGKNKGNPLNAGVFTYLAKIKMNDGIERQFSGSVNLLQ